MRDRNVNLGRKQVYCSLSSTFAVFFSVVIRRASFVRWYQRRLFDATCTSVTLSRPPPIDAVPARDSITSDGGRQSTGAFRTPRRLIRRTFLGEMRHPLDTRLSR